MSGVVALLAYPFLALYHGFALSLMWGWFVVPAFSVPALSVIDAIGVSLIVSTLRYRYHKDEMPLGLVIVASLFSTTLFIAFGFIWSQFR